MANGETAISDFHGVASMIRLTDSLPDGYVDNARLFIGNTAATNLVLLHTATTNG